LTGGSRSKELVATVSFHVQVFWWTHNLPLTTSHVTLYYEYY